MVNIAHPLPESATSCWKLVDTLRRTLGRNIDIGVMSFRPALNALTCDGNSESYQSRGVLERESESEPEIRFKVEYRFGLKRLGNMKKEKK